MGSAPFLGGGFGHFFAYAPEKFEYPINRYSMEAKRQFDVLNRRLAESEYIAGADYTIADIAIWPWYGGVALGRSYPGADEFLATHEYEHVMRWAKQIDARPAVKRGRIVNKLTGDESEQLHERHDASDFELRTQDKLHARRIEDRGREGRRDLSRTPAKAGAQERASAVVAAPWTPAYARERRYRPKNSAANACSRCPRSPRAAPASIADRTTRLCCVISIAPRISPDLTR